MAGMIPPEACTTPFTGNPNADPATVACIAGARSRSVEHIDGTCTRDGAALECHAGRIGADWIGLVADAVDVEASALLCGSTSGAFVVE